MNKNESNIDRTARGIFALIAAACAAFVAAGTLQIVLWVVAAILAVTAVIGFCPIYRLLGISTCKVK